MVDDVSLEKLRSTDFPQLSISEISPLLKQPVVEHMPLTGMQIQSGSSQATAQGFERILNEPPIVLKEIPIPTFPSATGREIRQPGEKSSSNPQVLNFPLLEPETGNVQLEGCLHPTASFKPAIG